MVAVVAFLVTAAALWASAFIGKLIDVDGDFPLPWGIVLGACFLSGLGMAYFGIYNLVKYLFLHWS